MVLFFSLLCSRCFTHHECSDESTTQGKKTNSSNNNSSSQYQKSHKEQVQWHSLTHRIRHLIIDLHEQLMKKNSFAHYLICNEKKVNINWDLI